MVSHISTYNLKITGNPGPGDCSGETVTGDNVTYIYPDNKTCLTGTFIKSRMVAARLASISHLEEQQVFSYSDDLDFVN